MTEESNILELAPRELVEDEPLTSSTAVHFPVPAVDPTPEQLMRIVEVSGTLDFWDSDAEDIYTSEDGEAA